jgi:hypothetical protein
VYVSVQLDTTKTDATDYILIIIPMLLCIITLCLESVLANAQSGLYICLTHRWCVRIVICTSCVCQAAILLISKHVISPRVISNRQHTGLLVIAGKPHTVMYPLINDLLGQPHTLFSLKKSRFPSQYLTCLINI